MTTEATAPPAEGSAAPPAGDSPPPAAPQRPDYLPEQFWDTEQGGVKPEFGQHYSELSTFKQTYDQQQEALKARKPEDIKIEVKPPEGFKLPDGIELKIDEKDPRIPIIRDLALKRGLDQDTVNDLVWLDAQMQIEAHNAERERIKAEDAKLGANGKDRKAAVTNWITNFKDLKPEHKQEIEVLTATAAGVELVEMLMARASGSVPGAGGEPPRQPAQPLTIEQRWYGGQKG